MAARLAWRNGVLCLGGLALYVGVAESDTEGRWEAYGDQSYGSVLTMTWETESDAMQDCESEVRRLLKEAGVEVIP
jgi:hypothetical protein